MMAGWILAGVFFALWLIEKFKTMTSRIGELMAEDMNWRSNESVRNIGAGNATLVN